jgi:glutathione S-transferase
VPAFIRPLVTAMIRRKVAKALRNQGAGRHSVAERADLAQRAFAAIEVVLERRPYLMGEMPCGADATVFAFVVGSLCPIFAGGVRDAAEARPALIDYCARMTRRFYPEMAG